MDDPIICSDCGETVPESAIYYDTWTEECHGMHHMSAYNGYRCPHCGYEEH